MTTQEERQRVLDALDRLHSPVTEKRVVIATETVEACTLLAKTGQALLASHRKTSLPRRVRALLLEVSDFLEDTTGKGLSLRLRRKEGVDNRRT